MPRKPEAADERDDGEIYGQQAQQRFSAGSRRSMAVRARHHAPSVPLTARQTRPRPAAARTARAARLRFFQIAQPTVPGQALAQREQT